LKIVVSAVKGAGKSTALRFVTEKRPDIKVIRVGDYFAKEFEKVGLKRDEGDKGISKDKHSDIQIRIFEQIAKDIEPFENVILDTNLLFRKSEGFFRALPEAALKIIRPDVLVVMEYRPEDILARRQKDIKNLGRERAASLTSEGVEEEQSVQKQYAEECKEIIGCELVVLRQDKPEEYEFQHNKDNSEEILKLFQVK